MRISGESIMSAALVQLEDTSRETLLPEDQPVYAPLFSLAIQD